METRRIGWAVLFLGFSNLAFGVTLTGRVLDRNAAPVFDVDLDLYDSATGVRVPTTADHTNAQGIYAFTVNPGTYDVAFKPLITTRLADKTLFNVVVSGNTNLGDTVLDAGVLITAHVIDAQSNAVANVDFDAFDSLTGRTLPTHADHTTVTGDSQFLITVGTRDFVISPDKIMRLVARVIIGTDVTGDTDLGTIQVQPGAVLSGHVTGPSGAAVPSVDINVYDESTGALVPTVGDNTDATGNYSVVVPMGSLTVDFTAPIANGFAHARALHVGVPADSTLNFTMSATPVVLGVSRSGRLALAGTSYAYDLRVRNTTASPHAVSVRVFALDPIHGNSATVLGPRSKTVPASFGPFTHTLPLRIPANVPARFRGRPIDLFVVTTDASSGTVLDSDFTTFTIR